MKTATGPLPLACIVLLANCASAAEPPQPVLPERAAEAREALVSWFECVECKDGELENLVRYQREVEGALIVALERGPSPAKRAEIESELRADFRQNPRQEGEERYVSIALAKADSAYRVRAIKALASLKTENARRALGEAAHGDPKASVTRAAQRALDSM
jgi:hypothetical protein